MSRLTTSIVVAALGLGLAGCGTLVSDKIAAADAAKVQGSAFNAGLHEGYMQQAKLEAKEYDFRDAERWADKALAASGNAMVSPEELGAWDLPKGTEGDLTSARARLMAALAAGAATKAAADASRAQVMFDCWVQEQEENIQPNDIRACRSGFEMALAKAEGALVPRTAAVVPPVKKQFVVFFDTAGAKIRPESQAVLSLVLAAAQKTGAKVTLAGHTDRAGAGTYNVVLSKKRVDAVAASLIAAGLAASTVNKSIHGEDKPAVATADGKREQKNRRVEITVE